MPHFYSLFNQFLCLFKPFMNRTIDLVRLLNLDPVISWKCLDFASIFFVGMQVRQGLLRVKHKILVHTISEVCRSKQLFISQVDRVAHPRSQSRLSKVQIVVWVGHLGSDALSLPMLAYMLQNIPEYITTNWLAQNKQEGEKQLVKAVSQLRDGVSCPDRSNVKCSYAANFIRASLQEKPAENTAPVVHHNCDSLLLGMGVNTLDKLRDYFGKIETPVFVDQGVSCSVTETRQSYD